jgi:hypothetical protein
VLREKKLDEIYARLNIHPEMPCTGDEGFKTATKFLRLKPFKTTVVYELQPHDPTNRVNICKWNLQAVYDDEVNPPLTCISHIYTGR